MMPSSRDCKQEWTITDNEPKKMADIADPAFQHVRVHPLHWNVLRQFFHLHCYTTQAQHRKLSIYASFQGKHGTSRVSYVEWDWDKGSPQKMRIKINWTREKGEYCRQAHSWSWAVLIDYTALFNISSLLDSQSSNPAAFPALRHFQSFHNIFTSFVTLSRMVKVHNRIYEFLHKHKNNRQTFK